MYKINNLQTIVPAEISYLKVKRGTDISRSLVKYRLPKWIKIVGFTPSLRSSTRIFGSLLLCPFPPLPPRFWQRSRLK